jgi:hypothetical protein
VRSSTSNRMSGVRGKKIDQLLGQELDNRRHIREHTNMPANALRIFPKLSPQLCKTSQDNATLREQGLACCRRVHAALTSMQRGVPTAASTLAIRLLTAEAAMNSRSAARRMVPSSQTAMKTRRWSDRSSNSCCQLSLTAQSAAIEGPPEPYNVLRLPRMTWLTWADRCLRARGGEGCPRCGSAGSYSSLADRGEPALAGCMAAVEAETIKRWFSGAESLVPDCAYCCRGDLVR